jgi:hypothetical protein
MRDIAIEETFREPDRKKRLLPPAPPLPSPLEEEGERLQRLAGSLSSKRFLRFSFAAHGLSCHSQEGLFELFFRLWQDGDSIHFI